MAFNIKAARFLLKESLRKPFKGSVLTLGRQDILFSMISLQTVAAEEGVSLSFTKNITLSHKPELALQSFISDDCFFRTLGFSKSQSMDFSDYEFPDYLVDLNSSVTPEYLCNEFDVIINGGTLEHVFHIPNALNNIYNMLRQGGRTIHLLLPSSNYVDHGFYMFSPTLFWDFYESNSFDINEMKMVRHTQNPDTEPWEISDYYPGCLDSISFGGLDSAMYGIICVATKTEKSRGNIVPQQRNYVFNVWKAKNEICDPKDPFEISGHYPIKLQAIKNFLKQFPFLYNVLWQLIKVFRLFKPRVKSKPHVKGLGLKITDRY